MTAIASIIVVGFAAILYLVHLFHTDDHEIPEIKAFDTPPKPPQTPEEDDLDLSWSTRTGDWNKKC